MDILNIISWVKGKRQVTSVDPTKSLIPVGIKDDRRDDGYLTGVITVEDLLAASASAIGVNGTSLYSTTPLAGPVGPDNNIVLGDQAGTGSASTAYNSNFLGQTAGYDSNNVGHSNFFGTAAGKNSNVNLSNFLGYYAGHNATNANYSNFLGPQAGQNATSADTSNFLGVYTGYAATNAFFSNFLGSRAGFQAASAYFSNFIGVDAGSGATTANTCNFLGKEAGMNSTGDNVNAFGYQAHKGGTLSGQTVFANGSLPSYTNRTAATTAISIPNGAVSGSTYLYYNQTTFAIEAVRL